MQLPTEIYDLITLYVEIDENTRPRHWQHKVRNYQGLGVRTRQRLAQLRLVNKAFYHSVSPRLFRHIGVRPKLNSSSSSSTTTTTTTTTSCSAFRRLEAVSKSQYAEYVRAVDFWFHSSPQEGADQEYLQDFARLLNQCLARFKGLKTLSFSQPHSDLPVEENELYVSSIVEMFRDLSFQSLEGLTLYFPLAHDFGRLFHSSSPELCTMNVPLERLRNLELGVYACTNPHLVGNWIRFIRPENAGLPNELYERYLYQLIAPANNLENLSIRSMDLLNLDSVDFSPPSLRHLRSLSLSAVSISADKLLSLFGEADGSIASEIKHIDFNIVKLTAGTWYHVLLTMSQLLPRLVDFTSESSGYSSTGSSAHLMPVLPRRGFATTYSIETDEAVDIVALGHLQRVVNGNRVKVGLEPYTRDDFEYLGEPPLELMHRIRLDLNISSILTVE